MSDLGEFLESKQREVQENENFLAWNKDNKLTDVYGEPLITFHGTINKHFDIINPDFYHGDSHVFGGFYSSNEIDDINKNYAGFGKDVLNRIDRMVEEIESELEMEEQEHEILENLKKEEYELLLKIYNQSDDTISIELFNKFNIDISSIEILRKEDYENNKKYSRYNFDRENLTINDFLTGLTIRERFSRLGEIIPVFIKMEEPCYIGFGGNYSEQYENTKIVYLHNYDQIDEHIENEENMEQDFEYYDELIELKSKISKETKIEDEDLDSYLSDHYCSSHINGEELFDTLEDIIDMYSEININDTRELLISIFKDNSPNIVEFDDDDEIISSADDIYIKESLNIDMESPEFIKGRDIIGRLFEEMSDYNKEIFVEKIDSMGIYEDNLLDMTELLKILRQLERESEFNDLVFNILSDNFDGIVMNAYEAMENDWGANTFEGVDYDTIHYITFKPNSVKNALYNNGKYSLTNDSMIERRSEAFVNYLDVLKKSDIQKHVDYISSKWKNAPEFKIKSPDFFSSPKTDAVVDIENNKVYLNERRMTSKEKLEKTMIHETVGHFGFRKFIGNKANNILNKIIKKYEPELKKLSKTYDNLDFNNKNDRMKLAEEFIAFKAEKIFPNDRFITNAKNKVKELFIKSKNKIGFKLNVDDEVFLSLKESFDKLKKKEKKRKLKI